jgi:multicomponent Na+:H+ antiporter subunit F
MSGTDVVQHATTAAIGILIVAMLLTILRLVRGPTLPDRILALDLLTTLDIGFIAAIAMRTGFSLYIDIAISIGLLGFLSTIAFARYVLRQAEKPDRSGGSSEVSR